MTSLNQATLAESYKSNYPAQVKLPEVLGDTVIFEHPKAVDPEWAHKLDQYSLEAIVEYKISRFLEQIGDYYPDDLHGIFMKQVEKPLIKQVLRRTGGNQVHAARILGINRNTLRKKIKQYGLTNI